MTDIVTETDVRAMVEQMAAHQAAFWLSEPAGRPGEGVEHARLPTAAEHERGRSQTLLERKRLHPHLSPRVRAPR
jgi:hypothetical protein